MGRQGFTLPELLMATALALLTAAGVLQVVASGQAASSAGAETVELWQRLRAVSEAMSADVASAGAGPPTGLLGRPLGAVVACVLPFVVGPRGDPAGTARTDTLTLVASTPRGAAAALAAPFLPSVGVAELAASPGCPPDDAACGVRAGDVLLLVDGGGQADLFDVTSVSGALLQLQPRGATSGRSFKAGARVVPVTIASYRTKVGAPADGTELVSGNGGMLELPFVDHVAGFEVQLFGEPGPPRLVPAEPSGPSEPSGFRATYGPTPPPVGVDNDQDAWPAGENCTFLVAGAAQQSRLPALGGGAELVRLPPALLTDGPWCPDAAAPNRVDADLFRVREARIVVRLEASSPAVRGGDSRLFAHPGVALDPMRWVPDRQVTVDVVPRALHIGR